MVESFSLILVSLSRSLPPFLFLFLFHLVLLQSHSEFVISQVNCEWCHIMHYFVALVIKESAHGPTLQNVKNSMVLYIYTNKLIEELAQVRCYWYVIYSKSESDAHKLFLGGKRQMIPNSNDFVVKIYCICWEARRRADIYISGIHCVLLFFCSTFNCCVNSVEMWKWSPT